MKDPVFEKLARIQNRVLRNNDAEAASMIYWCVYEILALRFAVAPGTDFKSQLDEYNSLLRKTEPPA